MDCRYFTLIIFFCCSLSVACFAKVESMVVFGDSLSDTGNTTHLLKSLRKEESAEYLVLPLEHYILNAINDMTKKYHTPTVITQLLNKAITSFFKQGAGPLIVNVVASLQRVPLLPRAPYWHYHFSNGKVWNEYLAAQLGLVTTDGLSMGNYAFGGSWAVTLAQKLDVAELLKSPTPFLSRLIKGKLIPPSLGLVVDAYLMEHQQLSDNTLFFLFAGGNDYLNIFSIKNNYDAHVVDAYINTVVSSIIKAADKLAAKGAKQLAFIAIPDIGASPLFIHHSDSAYMTDISTRHNQRLQREVKGLAKRYPALKVSYINTQALMYEVLKHQAHYGFHNVTQSCMEVPLIDQTHALDSAKHRRIEENYVLDYVAMVAEQAKTTRLKTINFCSQPQHYIFWDDIHPTTAMHAVLSHKICSQLKHEGYVTHCRPIATL